MYRQPSHFYGDGAHGAVPSSQSSLPSPLTSDRNHLQSPNFFVQNANFVTPAPFNQFFHRPNYPNQNPRFPIQYPNLSFRNNIYPSFQGSQNVSWTTKEAVGRIDGEVLKARHDLIASGEHVSVWKVSQAALLALQVDSWESLGLQIQQVPSLYRLSVTEGKINSFIQCFVAVHAITSLYDLEVAICKNEGVRNFKELELGPLVRHPLIEHYFSMNSNVTEVFKITNEEIMSFLCEFINTHKIRRVRDDEFLEFIANKQSIRVREKLCVRIQNLRWYVSLIRQAKQSGKNTLSKCLDSLKMKSKSEVRRRPFCSSQKKHMDDHFTVISQRIKLFSSTNETSCGKHIRFMSSSSESDGSADCKIEEKEEENLANSPCKLPMSSVVNSDRVSSCPYPSATEEMTRLVLKSERDASPFSASANLNSRKSNASSVRKRKSDSITCRSSGGYRRRVDKDKLNFLNSTKKMRCDDLSLTEESIRIFISTWKEACQKNDVAEVFGRMLRFYGKTLFWKSLFSSFPFAGLLNVAVKSIKCGMWGSMYDTYHFGAQEVKDNINGEKSPNYLTVDGDPKEKDPLLLAEFVSKLKNDVNVSDILKKIFSYFEHDDDGYILDDANLPIEKKSRFLAKICKCQFWLADEFGVGDFESLDQGEYFLFLEKHFHMLPLTLQRCFSGDTFRKSPFEASMLHRQLAVFLSQASSNLLDRENLSRQKICELLTAQFPSICFKALDYNGEFSDILRESKDSVVCQSLIFSIALIGKQYIKDSVPCSEQGDSENTKMRIEIDHKSNNIGSRTSKDAIESLRNAPMLVDLNLWLHWDVIYAPSLGPLVGWLLNEVNDKDLCCLVTRNGKVIRVDSSATLDSFLEAILQGSSFLTAIKILSLIVLYGGTQNVPSSLLKCYSHRAFEVLCKNSMEKEITSQNFRMGKSLHGQLMLNEISSVKFTGDFQEGRYRGRESFSQGFEFVLDCLDCLPSEFQCFAADILLSGLRSVIKDAPTAILGSCQQTKQLLMIHELGLALGIVEWINDYHKFHCLEVNSSCLGTATSDGAPREHPFSELVLADKADEHDNDNDSKNICSTVNEAEVFCDSFPDNPVQNTSKLNQFNDPVKVIESIRQNEFGLDPSLSDSECGMLKKQHARLGRALHCLSQELYSQDSHFLLELVQNADDNFYPTNVEATLAFILQENSIVVLNNEQGFSTQNIRALCDIGNSTKKGSSVGYIGKKGIGFKSVFRVTDAPEIHSNGFHIKFDISDGQIGFILPTVVHPCDVNSFGRLVSTDDNKKENDSIWNTCIMLPFRRKLSSDFTKNSIISMFSDLHPSLLLFLHRLRCIKFRNMLKDSLIVMRKEEVRSDIIVIRKEEVRGDNLKVSLGMEKMTWLKVSQKLKGDDIRPDVPTTEISIAFTLQDLGSGDYMPFLHQQPVFAFLPLRTYGLKFIIQGDFVLPSSREEVDGDSSWNQWLLSEFPALFIKAEKSFCKLPCFRKNMGKGVSTLMSFVPLVGEVHGFFSGLPHLIISKLRTSNCLFVEGNENIWVPPCKALRNWSVEARTLLPDGMLHEHLRLGYLSKDIVVSDALAKALGIEEYGPKILVKVISVLCQSENGLKTLGFDWLFSWMNALYVMLYNSSAELLTDSETEADIIMNLKKNAFIPLSDGKYGSVNDGSIWLPSNVSGIGSGKEYDPAVFPRLFSRIQIISPSLFSAGILAGTSSTDVSSEENVTRMLSKIGVQHLSAHEIINMHVLPAISDVKTVVDRELMIDYLSFVMFHLQSHCGTGCPERDKFISELCHRAFILTNHGYAKLVEVPIHFSKEFGNQIDVSHLLDGGNVVWYEVDSSYLKHPVTTLLYDGLLKWRNFFQELGVTDFVRVVQIKKSIADASHVVLNNLGCDKDTVSPGSLISDWESEELVHFLSLLSLKGAQQRCNYLFEILDTLWDDCFHDKVTGICTVSSKKDISFKSSLISSLHHVNWIASTIDDDLHCPRDLFYDCESVRSVLGCAAPYAVPKVRSKSFLEDIGFKTVITLGDALSVVNVWRRARIPFKTSILQMSKFYSFIWNEMVASREKVLEELHSGPFIFVPCSSGFPREDIVPGVFWSPEDLFWQDSLDCMEQLRKILPSVGQDMLDLPFDRKLYNIYPGFHDFFVDECGVNETPSFNSYLQFLRQLSTCSLPSQTASVVFKIFMKWTDWLNCGVLSSNDITFLKDSLLKVEYAVLPTAVDKWVSLHPSFGLLCWGDDEPLKREFKHFKNFDFVYFGELDDEEKELLHSKVSILLRRLGIPSLSKLVTREAICHGFEVTNSKASLVNWALPYAQRYIYNQHPDRYAQLTLSGFDTLKHLQIVVVEQLFYRNVVKGSDVSSKKQFECSCLLQGNVLYTTQESDSHSLFLELSRLLFDGRSELHFANFLHMITTMIEKGSSEERLEHFILNSQKFQKLPDGESVWSLPPSAMENENVVLMHCTPGKVDESAHLSARTNRGINSSWPPTDWETTQTLGFAHTNGLQLPAGCCQQLQENHYCEEIEQKDRIDYVEINADLLIEGIPEKTGAAVLPTEVLEGQLLNSSQLVTSGTEFAFDPVDQVVTSGGSTTICSTSGESDQLCLGTANPQRAMFTGRVGEYVAYRFFLGKAGYTSVRWVNEINETGLPYDIVLEANSCIEYVEVKATSSRRKDWFDISVNEWQFAKEKGESFSIARVVFLGNNMTKIITYKNPVSLCQQGKLKLAVIIPKE